MKLVKNKNMLLLFVLLGAVLLMSIGYASINSISGEIEGDAIADAQEGVFITNIEYVSDVNASNSRINNYVGTVMNSTIQLSDTNVNSNITYKVTVYNKGTEEAVFQKITYANDFYDNNDIIFDISGFTTGEKIGPGESRYIIIKFKYKGTTVPDNNVLNSYLNFVIKIPNRMMANSAYSSVNYLRGDIDKTKIVTISFKQGKKSDLTVEPKSEFDASEKQNKSIMGYYTDENNDGMYDLTFMSEGTIYANKDGKRLFYDLTGLTSIDLSNFKTDGVKDMISMFYNCSGLTSLDLSNFNTSQVTSMYNMFHNCRGLTKLDVSNFNTSQVTGMDSMFYSCEKLTSLDVSNFNTSKVKDMHYMFTNCYGLTSLDVSNFNTSNVTNMSSMFDGCHRLTSLDVSNFNTSQVKNMSYMFANCYGLTSLDVSNFNTSQVTNMSAMFYLCGKLTSLDVSNFNTSQVTDMSFMFDNCRGLTSLDVSNFNTSQVTNMSVMFSGCSGLTSLDLSNFNTSQVTDMSWMFSNCSGLTSLYVSEYNSETQKGWTTENVTSSSSMFSYCYKLKGGNGTKYNSSYQDATYAVIDTASTPGYLTEKGAITTAGTYLPKNFTQVEGTDLSNGLTIQDSKGNKYVWVEVPKTAEVYPTAGLKITEFTKAEYTAIETDLHTYTADYRNGTSYKDTYYSDDTTGLTSARYTELKQKMLKSVYQNGGFYIGKYETGIEDAPKTSGSSSTAPTETPVIKPNAYPYNNVTCKQAQTLASNMEHGDRTTSLLFGVQWDLVMKYLETKGTAQADLKTDSTSWGNYRNNAWNIINENLKYTPNGLNWSTVTSKSKTASENILLSTGADETFSKMGIYDLAGNVWEWTLEYTSNDYYPCATRGGYYYYTGSYSQASNRDSCIMNDCYYGIGARVALY